MARSFCSVVNGPDLQHILHMLDAMREREPSPERIFSPCEFGAIARSLALPQTPTNMLALMLAVGTGRFPRIDFEYVL